MILSIILAYATLVGFINITEILKRENNTLYNNFGNSINIDSGSHDINIVGNNAYNNSETGLLCSDTCNITIFYNNTVHDNGWSGLPNGLQINLII